jgi:hypothetical protein
MLAICFQVKTYVILYSKTIIKVLCLEKCFQQLIKEKAGLDENEDIPDHFIPDTFKPETDLLDEDSMSILKCHYMASYWQLRKTFLDYLEDSMSQDSLIGSTISTRSKMNISCASNISSPSVLSQDTKTSKVSERSNKHDFYPKNLNDAFLPKPDFEGDRNSAKNEYKEHQDYLAADGYQEPDHPSTFMKMIKGRANALSTANDERRQVLPSRVIWDGSLDHFEEFRNKFEGHYGQIGAAYLFDSDFQKANLENGAECYTDFLDEVQSASQIKKDACALNGALLSAFQSGVGRRILMENRSKQDGIRSWCQLVQQYETNGNQNVRIKKLENVITTVFHRNYRGGLVKWI